jgi:hypothetical protein
VIDPTTIVLATINVLASMIVFGIVSWKLVMKADHFTIIENIGMGLTAAGAVMTIGPITFDGSPFDDWASILMRIGIAIYFVGRVTRHKFNNWLARREAEKRFQGRG